MFAINLKGSSLLFLFFLLVSLSCGKERPEVIQPIPEGQGRFSIKQQGAGQEYNARVYGWWKRQPDSTGDLTVNFEAAVRGIVGVVTAPDYNGGIGTFTGTFTMHPYKPQSTKTLWPKDSPEQNPWAAANGPVKLIIVRATKAEGTFGPEILIKGSFTGGYEANGTVRVEGSFDKCRVGLPLRLP